MKVQFTVLDDRVDISNIIVYQNNVTERDIEYDLSKWTKGCIRANLIDNSYETAWEVVPDDYEG